MLNHGYNLNRNPVLRPLDTIEQRDAVLNVDGTEAEWPVADVIIGNPPFLGDKKMRGELGDEYTGALRKCYIDRVPGGADLVTYWFEKARAQIEAGKAKRAGLVATNSIRGGANRKVLDRICDTGHIFHAWSDEPWINEGAAVRVSLVCFGKEEIQIMLDGKSVMAIHADLISQTLNNDVGVDLTQAKPLVESMKISFIGTSKKGKFEFNGDMARKWLVLPNPHGKTNSNVIKPWANGMDITRRWSDTWIVDFGTDMQEADASLYEQRFLHVIAKVKPARDVVRNPMEKRLWWLHARSLRDMRKALAWLPRYICTSRVSKHRLFVWLHSVILPDSATVAIACSDDVTFGILHSRFHEIWSLRLGTSLEDRPRYTPTTTFETFPFPADVLHNPDPDARFPDIAKTASRLNELRENWLNPPEWVDRVPEVISGYPDRIIPKPGHETELKKRTLTNLYNQRPAWLDNAHKALDKAVAEAYGWTDYTKDMPDEEILRRLLALNFAIV